MKDLGNEADELKTKILNRKGNKLYNEHNQSVNKLKASTKECNM